ncbi:MAG: hypothetical protein KDB48_07480 [Solirubrobacterales bacterium]|nr:hypothetical protein [Solirubrobacterales bacterium]HMT04779.1 hypothetical protein [Solirubrobacterales bacterium]
MTAVWFLIGLGAVGLFVSFPFWGGRSTTGTEDPEIAALEAARESKYREIRDAETDYESGKLSEEDFKVLEAELKSEAVAILDRLEALRGKEG